MISRARTRVILPASAASGRICYRRLAAISLLAASTSAAAAQIPAPRTDTLYLSALQQRAVRNDPRGRQIDLLAAQSALRTENIRADQKPTLSVDGQAQYVSDVPRIPVSLPGGLSLPRPPHDTYDARLGAQYRLFDPTIAPRRAVEHAQLAESQARVRTSLYTLEQNVNDAFFAALRAQEQIAELSTTITDLEAQGAVAATRVKEGAALPSEEYALRAELLRRRQTIAELSASRRASLAILSDLAGEPIDTTRMLVSPNVTADITAIRASLDSVRRRPEYQQFASTRELIDRQRDARLAQDKPRISAFGRVGYGRPGLNPLNTSFDAYWLAGVQLQWTPWNWGTTSRDREVLTLQRQIVEADEAAFADQLRRAVRQDLESIDRLERTLASDDDIIALRENVAAEARARFAESVITSAEYIDRQTDVLSARLTRSIHRVELAQARAHFLTTLGIELR